MQDPRTISLRLDGKALERLRAWADQAGVGDDLEGAATRALLAFLDDQPRQTAMFVGLGLSDTESEVMQRTARGEESSRIADELGMTPNAVAQARYRALKKGAGGRQQVALGQIRERAFDRAKRRVLGAGPDADREVGFLRPPPDVRDGAEPEKPDRVMLGAPPGEYVGRVWEDDARRFRPPRKVEPLSGYTNRIGPTLWASTRLVLLAGDQGAVTPGELLETLLPDAWRIGAGLEAWEAEQRAIIQGRPGSKRRGVPFHFSARWPSLSGAEAKEASSVVSFVQFSIGEWRGSGSPVLGPLFTLGLAEILPVPARSKKQPLYLRPTRKALGLAQALARAGASCWYPYSDEAWQVIRECLRATPEMELDRVVRALQAVGGSTTTKDFQQAIASTFEIKGTGSRRKTEASGHLARLRELGLVTIPGAYDLDLYRPIEREARRGTPAFGPDSVTMRGMELLDHEGARPPRRRRRAE